MGSPWSGVSLFNFPERKYPKTGVKALSSEYRRKELCQNVGTGTALHHPQKDHSNQEMPISACRS